MQLEDPFGFDKNDIRMDAIVEDVRTEIMVLLEEWKRVGLERAEGRGDGEMFIGKVDRNRAILWDRMLEG